MMLSGAKPKVNYGLARCRVAFKTGILYAIKAGMVQEAQLADDPDEQLQTRQRPALAEPGSGLEAGGAHVPDVLFAKVGQASRLPGRL
jgi:hypothetical protein